MNAKSDPVKAGQGAGDEGSEDRSDGRETVCKKCKKPVRWTRTASGRPAPCDPPLVYVRGAAHGEDALARLEWVVVAETVGGIERGASFRGVRCDKSHPGAVAGRISHFATCLQVHEVRAEVKAKQAAQIKQEPAQITPAQGELVLGASQRAELAGLLRDMLEEELERQGCVWGDSARGLVITRDTRPQEGSVGAVRIARLCAAVRVVEGLAAGTWCARRGGEP